METHNLESKDRDIFIRPISYKNHYDFSKIHRHTYYEILLFENGAGGNQVIDFEQFSIENDMLYMVAPNQAHLIQRKMSEDGCIIQFSQKIIESCLPYLSSAILFTLRNQNSLKLEHDTTRRLLEYMGILDQLLKDSNGVFNEKIKLFLSFFLCDLHERLQGGNEKEVSTLTLRFIDEVQKHFKEDRNIRNYADRLFVSTTTLSKQIKGDIDKTPLEIVHEYLIVEIKRLMIIEKFSHKEISHYLHFDSQSSYSRFVVKMTGLKPSDLFNSL
ncbi:AraC family transcriptional regulator [Halosquirtibacter xylanolyticus]|uniref:helix-turn-helix domain-containing protein n=1 Tax=Halosquirtibacter xylanolyticus TaxID=3374599 RepID=UPI003748DC48|nr:AraC family transcriptional regulator [Prolixibacteraceae bacterium]